MKIDYITDRKYLDEMIDALDVDDSAAPTVDEVRDALERVQDVAEAVFQYTAYPKEGDAQIIYETWTFAVVAGLEDSKMVEDGLDSVFESAHVEDDLVQGIIHDVFEEVVTEYMDEQPDSEYVVIQKHGGWRQGEGWMTGRLRYLTEEVGLSAEEALDYYIVGVIGLDAAELADERDVDKADIEANVERTRERFR